MNRFSDRSSILLASTKWTLDEHLLFQRRLCRVGVALMSKRTAEVKVFALASAVAMSVSLCQPYCSGPPATRQTLFPLLAVNFVRRTFSDFVLRRWTALRDSPRTSPISLSVKSRTRRKIKMLGFCSGRLVKASATCSRLSGRS